MDLSSWGLACNVNDILSFNKIDHQSIDPTVWECNVFFILLELFSFFLYITSTATSILKLYLSTILFLFPSLVGPLKPSSISTILIITVSDIPDYICDLWSIFISSNIGWCLLFIWVWTPSVLFVLESTSREKIYYW